VTAIDAARAVCGARRCALCSRTFDVPKLPRLEMPVAITHVPLQSGLRSGGKVMAVALVIAQALESAEEAAALVQCIDRADRCTHTRQGRLEAPPEIGLWIVNGTKGDPQRGFEAAAKRIEQSYFQPTRNHNPMETIRLRGAVER
jgi:xanthine dehydrogenase YagR molybdenum-binding subunit